MKLLIASRNAHKVEEIRAIFAETMPNLQFLSLDDFPAMHEVEENGATFEENAIKKARETALVTGCWVLADDSGLEVAALDNAPGVYSARYAGEQANHAKNNEKLLRELTGKSDRRARFRCVIALSDPSGRVETVSGSCEGRIIEALRGAQGFGYDPLFVPNGFETTFAEMESSAKNALSHRGLAMQKACAAWRNVLLSGSW